VAAGVKAEIERVKARDADFASPQTVLHARMAAVLAAQRAMAVVRWARNMRYARACLT
jgi:hypothetical protein